MNQPTQATDLLVVAYFEERFLLRLQAVSIARMLAPGAVDTIHIVLNEVDQDWLDALTTFVKTEVLPAYGPHAARVRLHTAAAIAPHATEIRGYDRQQVLKLRATATLSCPAAIVLDCKNILIRPLDLPDIFAADTRARAPFENFDQHLFAPLLAPYHRLLGGARGNLPALLPATMTPYVLLPHHVRSLIATLETNTGAPIEAHFAGPPAHRSEFLLYAIHLQRTGVLAGTYVDAPNLSLTFWGIGDLAGQNLWDALRAAERDGRFMIGMHLRRIKQMDESDQAALSAFLAARGILGRDETLRLV